MQIEALDHLVLTVADIPATVTFYETHLGMTAISFDAGETSPRHALKFGSQKINLHQAGAEFEPKSSRPTPGSADLCFLVSGTIDDWMRHLSDAGIAIEIGPVARTGATGPLMSLYVRDPDLNLIELSTSG